jgi:DNA helicase-2/ATP-dependent DNA helicase PcrA
MRFILESRFAQVVVATGNQAQIDEERRLLYVAMTRAKRHLHLLVPQRFYVSSQSGVGDRHVYSSLTRFIPPEVASLVETCGPARPDEVEDAGSMRAPAAKLDVVSRLRAKWR